MTGESGSATMQSSFSSPMERSREVMSRLSARADGDETVVAAVSGGTDSVVAADVFARLAPEYGLGLDKIVHIRTGTGVPQTRLTARLLAHLHDVKFIEQGYRNPQDAIAVRVLNHGWSGRYAGSPWTGGHGLEWANRKSKPMDEVYVMIKGPQIWVSGARKLESKKRQGNVPDAGIESDKPRRTWVSIISGWTSEEKREYIRERGLPVSQSYLLLGFSGECTACSFDNNKLLSNLDLVAPELSHCIRTLAVWLYQRVRAGQVDLAPKRLVWGWEPDGDDRGHDNTDQQQLDGSDADRETEQEMVGCSEGSCGPSEAAEWVRALPEWQLIDREDVETFWRVGELPISSRFDDVESPHAAVATDGGKRNE